MEKENEDDLASPLAQITPSNEEDLAYPLAQITPPDEEDLASPLAQITPTSLSEGDIEDAPLLTRRTFIEKTTPPPLKEMRPKFIDLCSVIVLGPEIVNGRLAMVGFMSAVIVELTKGQDLFTQITNGGYLWFLWTTILFTIASVIPFSKGMGPDTKSDSFWNTNAEVWNGRAAMLGLVALALTELFKGGPLV